MTDMPNRRENRIFRSLGLEVVGTIKDVPIDNMKRSSIPNNGSLSAVTFDQSSKHISGGWPACNDATCEDLVFSAVIPDHGLCRVLTASIPVKRYD